MRHWAWLNAVPEREANDRSKATRLSRIGKLRKDFGDEDFVPDLPEPEGADHLVEYLWEVGPTLGSDPLTHSELRAWQDSTGIELQPWEARFLRRLSVDYLRESYKATAHDCPAPSPEYALNLSITWKSVQKSMRELANL